MVHYRVLFVELLDGGGSSTGRTAEENVPGR
jgi:hypothetical protein